MPYMKNWFVIIKLVHRVIHLGNPCETLQTYNSSLTKEEHAIYEKLVCNNQTGTQSDSSW
jgi:hypothetical protein